MTAARQGDTRNSVLCPTLEFTLAKREIPEKLVLCGTGSSFTFSA